MKSTSNPTSIIAFFARGREIGFIVLDSGEIIRYGVKTIKGKRQGAIFTRKVEDALLSLLKLAAPDGMIVMERIADFSRKGALCQVMCLLAKRWKQRGYPICFLSLEAVKRSLCEGHKATHRELVETIVKQYHPILWPVVMNQKKQKAMYWEKVGIAMALAEVVTNRSRVV